MAAGTQGAAKEAARRDGKAPPPEEREPTKRVVLKLIDVLPVAEGTPPEKIAEAAKLLGIKGAGDPPKAWVTVGVQEAPTKEAAIELHTGKPGTADAKCGTFKAPTVKAWAGGLRLVAPPKPLVEKESIE